jgi:hypothetical protein
VIELSVEFGRGSGGVAKNCPNCFDVELFPHVCGRIVPQPVDGAIKLHVFHPNLRMISLAALKSCSA